ncbi:MAG: 6-phosphogluconolactonase [Bacteroidetes bacterium]|nr:6-phosphogluconolactonase [Bacteroidota bacterium]
MKLHLSKTLYNLSIEVADHLLEKVQSVLKKKTSFSLVLSGGSTPIELYTILASDQYKEKIDWNKMHIFFGDERFVPLHDKRNNAHMAFSTFLNQVSIPASQVHIIHTEHTTPEHSAKEYEQTIRSFFSLSPNMPIGFDLVLLGLGSNAHTLSLFPGQDAIIYESLKWCLSTWVEEQHEYRITLTPPLINLSAQIYFMVSGMEKAKAMEEILKGKYQPGMYPAQIINPTKGELHWFADEDAASLL